MALPDLAAADPDAPPERPGMAWQVWAGADVSENIWLLYSGVTVSPWSVMHENGLKFRAAAGYGAYRYTKAPEREPDPLAPPRVLTFEARTHFTDLLVGYLLRVGELTGKAFVGASLIAHDIAPNDENTVAFGEDIGFKGVIELWLNIGSRGWGSLDLSWSTAHETRSARARLGYRVWPELSLGLEGGLTMDSQGVCRMKGADAPRCANDYGTGEVVRAELLDYARVGAFARYEWDGGEISVSAGALGEALSRKDDVEIAPYVTVNWLTQF